jgi:hypothetical protein
MEPASREEVATNQALVGDVCCRDRPGLLQWDDRAHRSSIMCTCKGRVSERTQLYAPDEQTAAVHLQASRHTLHPRA